MRQPGQLEIKTRHLARFPQRPCPRTFSVCVRPGRRSCVRNLAPPAEIPALNRRPSILYADGNEFGRGLPDAADRRAASAPV